MCASALILFFYRILLPVYGVCASAAYIRTGIGTAAKVYYAFYRIARFIVYIIIYPILRVLEIKKKNYFTFWSLGFPSFMIPSLNYFFHPFYFLSGKKRKEKAIILYKCSRKYKKIGRERKSNTDALYIQLFIFLII